MKNLSFKDKKVLIRVDFNVPVDKQYQITDDTRIQAALPTLNHILSQGGSLIILSHFGRPDEKFKPDGSVDVERFTQRHLLAHLSKVLNRPVQFCDELTGEKPQQMAAALKPGDVLLMENTRFHPGEKKGNEDLAREWASLADIYINDAFGTAHRAHASTTTVAKFFGPDAKGFGFLMDAEVASGKKVLDHPERPLTAIIGGAKVSDKILLLERLINLADNVIVGGGMAYTFMKAQGGQIGKSLVEEDRLELAAELIKKAAARGVNLLLPEDSVIADNFANDARIDTADSNAIPDGWMGLDIGPKAREAFNKAISSSQTILWNGPMGVFEMPNFAQGTRSVAEAVAAATQKGAFSLVGGGDSVAAINQLHLNDQISFVSTGGGAMLELLEGKELPGVKAIAG